MVEKSSKLKELSEFERRFDMSNLNKENKDDILGKGA